MQTYRKTAAQPIEPQDFLLPEPSQRRRPGAKVVPAIQIEDAVFEIVVQAPHQYSRVNDNPPRSKTAEKPEILPALARFAGRLAAGTERQLSKLSPQVFVGMISSLFLLVFWICGGFSAINASASMAPPVQVFSLTDTSVDVQDANGMKIAMVTGGVVNISTATIPSPRLQVLAGSRQDLIGMVSLPVAEIGPGMTIRFSGRFKLNGGKSTEIAIVPNRP